MIQEISKLKGFENCTGYYIYSDGRVYSDYKKDFLKPLTNSKGYKYIDLRNRNPVVKMPKIHKLVMLAFSKDKPLEQVNHIDGNKSNNHISNLEYVSNEDNRKHAIENRLKDEIKYEIAQYDLDGNLLNVFRTAEEALIHLGKPPYSGNIGRAIRGHRKTCYGYIWKQYEGSTTRV